MIELQPVPEGLLKRALDTTFTTESWAEWDGLNLVPDFDGSADIDDLDFNGDDQGNDDETASEDAATTSIDSTGEPDSDPENNLNELPDPLAAFEDSSAAASDQFDSLDQFDLDLDDFDFS